MSEAAQKPTAERPPPAESGPQFSPEAMAFAGKLASAAMAAENHALLQVLQAADSRGAATIETAELRRAWQGAWFQIEVPGTPKGPRMWLLPHLFADVVLELPGRVHVKVRAKDVRTMFAWLKGGAAPASTAKEGQC